MCIFETVDSSHEKEMGTYAVHACHDKKPVVDTKEQPLPAQNKDGHMFYQTDIVSVFQKTLC